VTEAGRRTSPENGCPVFMISKNLSKDDQEQLISVALGIEGRKARSGPLGPETP
jgi:hypothetical protein